MMEYSQNNNQDGILNTVAETIKTVFRGRNKMEPSQNQLLEQRLEAAYEALIKQGLSEKKSKKAIKQMRDMLQKDLNTPPKIAFIGMCGVGKSTTINALFNAGRPVSHSVPCTKKAEPSIVTTSKGIIEVYDTPGLGEGEEEDENYYEAYKQLMPNVDVILCIITDRSQFSELQRAVRKILNTKQREKDDLQNRIMTANSQEELTNLQMQLQIVKETEAKEQKKLLRKMVFAVNKVDLSNGRNDTTGAEYDNNVWNTLNNLPSQEQKKHIDEFAQLALEKIKRVAPDWKGNICTYSATKRYHLEQLFSEILRHIELKNAWKISELAEIADFMELVPPDVREKMIDLQQQAKKKQS